MKKQMIVIAFLSAVACLTGCGADINVTTAQPAAAPVSAVSAGAAQTSAPAADASATTTADAAKTAGVQADIQNIIGIWNEADVLDSRTLTVNADGTYELAYRGGGKQYGTVTVSTGQTANISANSDTLPLVRSVRYSTTKSWRWIAFG